jgi:transposase
MILTDEQWRLLQPLFPSRSGPGRPCSDPRMVLDACLWRRLNARPWRALPPHYPAFQVCHRTSHKWSQAGIFHSVYQLLELDLRTRGHLDLRTCFADSALIIFARPDGIKLVLPAPQFQDQWQYTTAMLFIAPAWHALQRAFRRSGPVRCLLHWQSLSIDEFQSAITDYLDRFLGILHRDTPGTGIEP